MNILFLCHRIPYPPNKGDKIRSFHEIKYLSKNNKIYLAFLVDSKKDLVYVRELENYCEAIDYDVIQPLCQKIKSFPYLFLQKPLTIPYFYSKKLQRAVDYRFSTVQFDAVIAFSSPMAEYVLRSKLFQGGNGGIKKPLFVMDFVDVDSDKWRMYAEFTSFPQSFIYKNEWKSLMAYEIKIAKTFDINIFVSDAEIELFQTYTRNHVNAISIPNGVDLSFFSHRVKFENNDRLSREKDYNVLFTGAMDYFPNEDGMLYFYRKIWPIVKNSLPESKFYIVGGKPSKKLKSISEKDKSIIVTGYTDDVRQYLWKADVFVAPLRIARGVQNKVLEAMTAGLPVVATPQAVQGIRCEGSEFLFIETSDERFAKRVIELSENHLSEDAIKRREFFLKHNYNWEINLEKLEKILSTGGKNVFDKM